MSDGKFSIPRDSIPGTWTVCRVQDAGTVQLGRQRSPKDHTGPNMRPYLRAANVFEDHIDISDVKEMNFTPDEFENFRLREGDILLNEGQSLELVGRPAMFRGEIADCCFQNTLVRFVPGAVLDGKFALKLFQHYMRNGRFQKIARWTTNIAHLGASRFADLEIPLPPLAEQKRIVAKIEELFSELEAGEESLRVARRQLGVYRQSLLKQAFEGHLTAKWRTQNPDKVSAPAVPAVTTDRELGTLETLPSGWVWTLLSNVGELGRGKSKHRPRNDAKLFGGSYPFIQTGEVKASSKTVKTYTETYSEFGLAQSKLWPKGTLCITIAANIAETAFLGFDACFPDSVVGFVPVPELVDPEYVELFIRAVRSRIEKYAPATAQKNINLTTLENLVIPLCSLPEQQEIVRLLDSAVEVIERNEREIDGALRKSEALRQAILQKAFTGRLVPQDPADESASELLARLKVARGNVPGALGRKGQKPSKVPARI